jgi:hypothetical protein
MSMERCLASAWLVEQTGLDQPYYLCGPCSGTFPFAFSADKNDAIRFTREQDAANMTAYFKGEAFRVMEHFWL